MNKLGCMIQLVSALRYVKVGVGLWCVLESVSIKGMERCINRVYYRRVEVLGDSVKGCVKSVHGMRCRMCDRMCGRMGYDHLQPGIPNDFEKEKICTILS